MADVVARVRLKLPSKDLKKTPNEEFIPIIMKLVAIIDTTITQP
jgi:hypothetical protein